VNSLPNPLGPQADPTFASLNIYSQNALIWIRFRRILGLSPSDAAGISVEEPRIFRWHLLQ
jgi:hypothetical protein